jgi:hypothetical protein
MVFRQNHAVPAGKNKRQTKAFSVNYGLNVILYLLIFADLYN